MYVSKYNLDIDYDIDYSNAEDYGRGSTIHNVRVNKVDISELAKDFIRELNIKIPKGDEIIHYCIDRILRYYNAYDTSKYEVSVCGGYYGQEINKVDYKDGEEVCAEIKKMLASENKIEYVLNLEYSHILPQLKNLNWECKTVHRSDIVIGNESYMKKTPRNDFYTEYSGIVCICTSDYRLWDGYHRYVASKDKKKIKVLVGTPAEK
jgi:hypothetical protein